MLFDNVVTFNIVLVRCDSRESVVYRTVPEKGKRKSLYIYKSIKWFLIKLFDLYLDLIRAWTESHTGDFETLLLGITTQLLNLVLIIYCVNS